LPSGDHSAAEESQLDHAALAIVELRQRLEGIVERDDIVARCIGDDLRFVEGHPCIEPSTFLCPSGARVVDENPTYDAGADREKVGSVVPRHVLGVNELQIRLVDERGGLKAVSGTLVGHVPARYLMELSMHERNQVFEGTLVATGPVPQQLGDLGRLVGNDAILVGFALQP
jgi:hypothetical protein